jgi:DNA-binding MarR family transcriptional regulator
MSSKSGQPSTTYLKFLNLVQALRPLTALPVMDPLEERLLNQLAASWHAKKQVTVLEAMAMSPDASDRTVHRRLQSLKDKGLIELVLDEHDSRIKYISPTAKATSYFAQLGTVMEEALRGSRN